MRLTNVAISNLRAIKKLRLPTRPGRLDRRTVIIGPNSTCKTTLLRAIAIGLCNERQASSLLSELPGTLVGEAGDEATIEVTIGESPQFAPEFRIVTTVRRAHYGEEDEIRPRKYYKDNEEVGEQTIPWNSIFLCAYGAGRGVSGTESLTRFRTIDSVYTLFRYDQSLQNPQLVLHRLKDFYEDIFELTKERLLRTLGLSTRAHSLKLTDKGVVISGRPFGNEVPLEAIADGYLSSFTWLFDFIGWAMLAEKIDKQTGEVPGILLVDEIEQHLHPKLHDSILSKFTSLFPSTQLITTTHSPLVSLAVTPGNLVVLRKGTKWVRAVDPVPDFSAFSADEILADPSLFDTAVISPILMKKIRKYRRLAQIPKEKRSKRQRHQIRSLANDLASSPSFVEENDPVLKSLADLAERLDTED